MKLSVLRLAVVLVSLAIPAIALTPVPRLVGTGQWKDIRYELRLRDAIHLKAGELDPSTSDPRISPRRAIQVARLALRTFAGEATPMFRVETVRLCSESISGRQFWFYVVEFWSDHESQISTRTTPLGEERILAALPFIVYLDEHIESPLPARVAHP